MKKPKVVKRTWFSKKLNKYVTKSYTYDVNRYIKRRSGKSLLLVGKNGRVYKDRINNFKQQFDESDRAIIDAQIDYYQSHGIKISERTLMSKLTENRYAKMFINAGYTLEEAAKELDVQEAELFDEKNWENNKFKNPRTGKEMSFTFNYYGSVWTE